MTNIIANSISPGKPFQTITKPIIRVRCSDICFSQSWRMEVRDRDAGSLGSWGRLSSWLTDCSFSRCLHVQRELSAIFSHKDTGIPSWGPPLIAKPHYFPTSLLNLLTSKPHYFPKAPSPNFTTWGLQFQHTNLGAMHCVHSTTFVKWNHNYAM